MKQNKTKFILAPFLMLILVGMGVNHAYATALSDTIKELDMPDITINPESGPVGTEITINVSNLPMPPDGADPRLEFYMYLPASGDNVGLTKCNDHCIILYSFDEIRNGETYPKEITFALPSVKNSDAYSVQLSASFSQSGIKQGAEVSSVCDIVINGKIQYRFGYSCNNYNTPVGEYEIDFGWAVGMADVYDKKQTVTFSVTDNEVEDSSTELTGDSSDLIFKRYEQGEITITQFVTALKKQGSWATDDDIRRALSLVGELQHQKGVSWVDANSKEKSLVSVVDNNSKEKSVVSVVDNNSKEKSVVSVVDNNSDASISKTSSDLKTSSEMDDIDSTVVYAIIIGGVIAGGAIFAAFGRNIF